jgi:hypothetical protein
MREQTVSYNRNATLTCSSEARAEESLRGKRPQYDTKWFCQEFGRSGMFAGKHKQNDKVEKTKR